MDACVAETDIYGLPTVLLVVAIAPRDRGVGEPVRAGQHKARSKRYLTIHPGPLGEALLKTRSIASKFVSRGLAHVHRAFEVA
jgi:hypothetical protein